MSTHKKIVMRVITAIFVFSSTLGNIPPGYAQGQTAQPAGTEKISLDLKGMDVIEVIKMLATKGNMNIILSNDVKGRVTIFLKSVNIIDAFEIILTANGLAYDKRGDIIYVMAQREYEAIYGEKFDDRKEVKVFQLKYAKATEISKALMQMKTKIGKIVVDEGSNTIVAIDSPAVIAQMGEAILKIDMPTETKVFELKYAKAADLKPKISEMLTKGVGAMQIDERTNKVAVIDLEKKVSEIERLIAAFDDKSQQVLIEAKIIQITLNDKYQLGIDWTAVIQSVGRMSKEINFANTFQLAAQNAFGPPGAHLVVGALGGSDWGLMIQALKTIGDTDLLSSPRITALNNQEAKIMIGKSQPYATNTVTQTTGVSTTATNLTFIDIGVKLYVTPSINKDGFVTMKIKPEVSSSSSADDYVYGSPPTKVPVVQTTQAETSITVKDGTTIIIAGLIKDERSSTINKLPILGDIPFAGEAFRQTTNQVQKQELVVFLTPHIVSGEYDVLEQPKTYPINEKGFTMPDKPTFERRNEAEINTSMFKNMKESAFQNKKAPAAPEKIIAKTQDDYMFAVKNRIIPNVNMPKARSGKSTKGSVKITFVLSPNGALLGIPSVVKSTNAVLEGPAVEAVKQAAPFPPFPQSMGPGDKRFSIDISNE